MVSEGMERVINLLKQFQEDTSEFSVEAIREGLDQLGDMVKLPKDVKSENVNARGVPAVWISTPDVLNDQVLLYLHGGGYIAGSIKSHNNLAARLSRVSKARVLVIEYRLAPEHIFPAAIEDSTKAYRWLVSNEGILPKNIIIGGDSAGGGLTIATLVNLRDEGDKLPAAAVCLSPWTDLAITGNSIKTNADIDPFVPAEDVETMAKLYYGDEDPKNPLVSPLYANLQGLPPLLIQVGTAEVLLDDSVRVAERAKEAGVEVQLEIWQDMIHVFAAFAEWAPEGQEGIDQIGDFIQKHIKKEFIIAD
jgi:monoterpene epsilon-lactone hydrolase